MTVNEKLSQIKKRIEEIKKITENLGNDNTWESKIEEMTKEIFRLKKDCFLAFCKKSRILMFLSCSLLIIIFP